MRRLSRLSLKKVISKKSNYKWILIGIILCFCFCTMYYTDIMIIYEEGLDFLDCLFSGNLTDFYNYSYYNSSFKVVAVYDILIYIIFAVWALPVWIIDKVSGGGINIFSIPCMLWFKSLLILFLAVVMRFMKKIAKVLEMQETNMEWMVYAFISSLLVILPVFELAQIDIICLAFMLSGIYFYMQKNMKMFLLFFAIAIPMKLFALFIFVPLLLLYEKKIIKILLMLAASMSIQFGGKLLFIFSTDTYVSVEKSLFNFDMLQRVMETHFFEGTDKTASVFVVCYLLLCIFTYTLELKTEKEFRHWSIYLSFVSFLLLFMFLGQVHPYWIIFLAPFLIITIFNNRNKLKINLILEIGLTLTFVWERMYMFWGTFGGSTTFDYLFLQNLGPREKFARVPLRYLMDYFEYSEYRAGVMGIFYACAIALIIINFPPKVQSADSEITVTKEEKGILCFRVLIVCLYIVALTGIVLLDWGTLYLQ